MFESPRKPPNPNCAKAYPVETTTAIAAHRLTRPARSPVVTSLLFHRGVVCGIEEDALDACDDFAIDLRLGRNLLPLRVLLKRRPALVGRVAALVRQQINQGVLRQRRVLRSKVHHILHAVLLEDPEG